MNTWPTFYEDRVGPEYFEYARKRYEPFIENACLLLWQIASNKHFANDCVEYGCGIGTMSLAISMEMHKSPFDFFLSDNNHEMIKLANDNINLITKKYKFNFINEATCFDFYENECADMTCRDFGFTHGVLEHFTPRHIRKIIRNFDGITGKGQHTQRGIHMHYVPTNKYKTKSFGDEHLWTPDYWVELTNPTRIELFNDDHDLILFFE